MPIADYGLSEALVTTLSIFFLVVWFWILITILADLFRDHELSGWFKAIWLLFLVVIPFLSSLVYLIARGNGMRERTLKAQAEARQHFQDYVQEAAQTSPIDELHKLSDLKERGAISAEEYERMKAKYVG
jgi:ABC-type transport system involved in cytochrome bd biosynthesis fused ATPase/permease subunit